MFLTAFTKELLNTQKNIALYWWEKEIFPEIQQHNRISFTKIAYKKAEYASIFPC
jgi:hypothetical protein